MKEAFLYEWTDTLTGKMYIGYHKGTINDGYICSSKPMLKEYKQRTQDFVRVIIDYGTHEEMRNLESEILKYLDVAKNPKYYNQNNMNCKFYCKGHTEETKLKMSNKRKGNKYRLGIPHSEESKRKMSDSLKGKNCGPFTESHKRNISVSLTGRKNSTEAKLKMSESHKGLLHSEESKRKMSLAKLGKKRGPNKKTLERLSIA